MIDHLIEKRVNGERVKYMSLSYESSIVHYKQNVPSLNKTVSSVMTISTRRGEQIRRNHNLKKGLKGVYKQGEPR